VDLNEAKQAATALFDKLDKDKDGTLTTKELQGRLSKKELAANDPDKDATLSKDEYLAIVDKRFTAADTNKDGSIDCKESQTIAGHALLRLLK
jgi:Ca2+-binding EF-hand superfamily protein